MTNHHKILYTEYDLEAIKLLYERSAIFVCNSINYNNYFLSENLQNSIIKIPHTCNKDGHLDCRYMVNSPYYTFLDCVFLSI